LIENSADGITLLNLDGAVIDISLSGERILGYPKEKLLGKLKPDLVHPDDIKNLEYDFAEINSQPGASLTGTYRIKHSNGTWLWIETIWNNLLENDNVRAIVLNFRDITARKLAEDSLFESREMLRLAMSGSRTGAWSRDIVNNKVEWSEELEAVFELPRGTFAESLSGFYDIVHHEDQERVRNAALKAVAEQRDYAVEFRFLHADQTLRWMEGRRKAVYASDGMPTKVYGIGTDITERKQAEEALQQSEARLRLVIEISRTATFEINLETDAVQTDEIGREIYGFEPNEPLTFTKVQSRFHPEDRDEVLRSVSLALAPESSDEFEVEQRIIRTNGETRWIRVRGSAFFEGEGDLRRAVTCLGTYIDVTERKRAEEDLRQKDEQLRQAHKLESVGRLAGGIAHDFNNMLIVIKGYSELSLQLLEESNPLREFIQEINLAAERSAAITQQLLAFSRQQIMQPKIISLNEIIKGSSNLLERLIGEDVTLSTILQNKEAFVEVDLGQMIQVHDQFGC
jgi:two-component system cell cycle sensor histidine kinase/response regulator CckA